MDYSRIYVGDQLLYQSQTCGNSVTKGSTYTVVKVLPNKPTYGIIIDDSGNEKLVKLGYIFAKIGGG